MKMKLAALAFAGVFSVGGCIGGAHAQTPAPPAPSALSNCLIRSTTEADHTLLAQWIFVTMSRHPSVASMSSVSDQQNVAINRQVGALLNRLLLDSCATETRAAVAAQGPAALEGAFEMLGRVAMTTLMGHPDVTAGLSGFAGYLDQRRLQDLLTKK